MNFIVLFAIFVTVVVETLEQLMFKASAKYENVRHQFLIAGIVLHVVQLASWFFVLASLPLNKAVPILGLTYITIAVASKYLFNEQVNKRAWIGIVSIIGGLALITGSGS